MNLEECYAIRKKLLQDSNSQIKQDQRGDDSQLLPNDSPEITRVSVLMLFLYQKIDKELQEKERTQEEVGEDILEVAQEVKNMFKARAVTRFEAKKEQEPQNTDDQAEPAALGEDFLKQLMGEQQFLHLKTQAVDFST